MAWCVQITRNEALRLIARRRAIPRPEPLEAHDDLDDDRATGEGARALDRIDVGKALQVLTPDERQLITLRYVYGCSHPQIAATLRIPEATARVRLHRARKRLRPLLDDHR